MSSVEQQRAVYLGLCRALAALTDDADAAALLRAEFTPSERATGQPQPGLPVPPLVVERAAVKAWVDDEPALLAWCEATAPEAIELVTVSGVDPHPVHREPYGEVEAASIVRVTTTRRVRPSYVDELLESARAHPESAVSGVRVWRYAPRVVIRLSEPAAAIADHAGGA